MSEIKSNGHYPDQNLQTSNLNARLRRYADYPNRIFVQQQENGSVRIREELLTSECKTRGVFRQEATIQAKGILPPLGFHVPDSSLEYPTALLRILSGTGYFLMEEINSGNLMIRNLVPQRAQRGTSHELEIPVRNVYAIRAAQEEKISYELFIPPKLRKFFHALNPATHKLPPHFEAIYKGIIR